MNIFRRKTASPAQSPSIYEGDQGDRSLSTRVSKSGHVLMDRATQIYRNNPKTVGGAALLGAVALLGLVKNRGIRRA